MPDFKILPTVNAVAVALANHTHPAATPVSGPGLWLDASQITGLADGAAVGTWADTSGNSRDVTAAGALRPLYKTSILNGRPVLRFDGFNTLSRASTLGTGLFGASAVTIVIVQKQDGGQANNTTLFWETAGNRVNGHLTYSDTLYFDYGNAAAGGRINGSQPAGWDDTWKIVTLHRNGPAGRIVVNGTDAVIGTFTDDLDPTQSNTLLIGSDGSGVSFKGDMAELLIYGRALTDDELDFLEAYLSAKYGIAVAQRPERFATAVKWGTD